MQSLGNAVLTFQLASSMSTTVCATCGEPAFLKCSRCLQVCYCSSACQKRQWPVHKTVSKKLQPPKPAASPPKPAVPRKTRFTLEERQARRQVARETTVKDCAMCTRTTASEGVMKVRLCKICRSVLYCSKRCQRKHWKVTLQKHNHRALSRVNLGTLQSTAFNVQTAVL